MLKTFSLCVEINYQWTFLLHQLSSDEHKFSCWYEQIEILERKWITKTQLISFFLFFLFSFHHHHQNQKLFLSEIFPFNLFTKIERLGIEPKVRAITFKSSCNLFIVNRSLTLNFVHYVDIFFLPFSFAFIVNEDEGLKSLTKYLMKQFEWFLVNESST